MEKQSTARLPVYIAVLLLVAVSLVFVFELVSFNVTSDSVTPDSASESDAVTAIVENGDATRGGELVEEIGCVVCHRFGAENGIAPSFVGVSERAAQRHPPLSAPAYIYESITSPRAFVVDGYAPLMPENFRSRLSDQQLGDIIAYLLSADAH